MKKISFKPPKMNPDKFNQKQFTAVFEHCKINGQHYAVIPEDVWKSGLKLFALAFPDTESAQMWHWIAVHQIPIPLFLSQFVKPPEIKFPEIYPAVLKHYSYDDAPPYYGIDVDSVTLENIRRKYTVVESGRCGLCRFSGMVMAIWDNQPVTDDFPAPIVAFNGCPHQRQIVEHEKQNEVNARPSGRK